MPVSLVFILLISVLEYEMKMIHVALVSTEWVYNRLGSVKVVDTTRHISPHKDSKTEFLEVDN